MLVRNSMIYKYYILRQKLVITQLKIKKNDLVKIVNNINKFHINNILNH